MARWFLLLGFCAAALPAGAKLAFSPNLKQAYRAIMDLRLAEGRQRVNQEPENNRLKHLVANYADALQLIFSENPRRYQAWEGRQDERYVSIREQESQSPYQNFALAEIKLQWAIVQFRFDDKLSAAWNLRQAYKLASRCHRQHPQFLPVKKTLATVDVMLGAVPSQYEWVLSSFGMEGNPGRGFRFFREVAQSNSPFAQEAALTSLYLRAFLGQGKLRPKTIEATWRQQKHSRLAAFVCGASLMKAYASEEALQVFRQAPSGAGYYPMPLFFYHKGEVYLQKGDYYQARFHYLRFLQAWEGRSLIKSTHYKLYLAHWLDGNKPQARYYRRQIPKKGHANASPDRYAMRFYEEKGHPHPELMQARLYSDGGFFDEALSYLEKIDFQSLKPTRRLEYHYRKGRILHLMGQDSEALQYYHKAIENQAEGSGLYFAPNAALQSGYIYQEKNRPVAARQYFQMAMDYEDHPYKSSIDAKARTALRQLKTP